MPTRGGHLASEPGLPGGKRLAPQGIDTIRPGRPLHLLRGCELAPPVGGPRAPSSLHRQQKALDLAANILPNGL